MARKFKPKQFFEQLNLGLIFDDAKPVVAEASPKITHYFAGWDKPVLETAVDFLAADWKGKGAIDLSGHLVLVPTRHASRRLREALAVKASEQDAAVLPPLVVTPNFLTDPARLEDLKAPAPERALTFAIWTSAMLDIDLKRYRNVFPVDPVDRNLSWAMKTAGDLLEVRELLCREGLSFAEAYKRLGPEEMESQRWRELARIEKEVVSRTRKYGYTDVVEANHKAAKTVNLPPEVKRIVVLACSDLPGMACRTLQEYSRKFPLDIVIAAPESHRTWFDEWGNPVPETWNEARIDLPDPEDTIQSAANPSEQAEMVCELLESHSDPALTAAIGVPDPETIAPVEQALASKNLTSHDPSGKPLHQHPVYYLLEQTHRLIESGSFDAFRQLLRIPDWLAAMMRSVDLSSDKLVSRTGFVRMMDKLSLETLPDSLGDARAAAGRRYKKHIELEHGISWAQSWLRRFDQDDFGDTVIHYLIEVFEKKAFPDDETDGFPEVAGHLMQCIDVIRESEEFFARPLSAASQFELLLELIKDRRLYPDRSANNVDLEGWIELLWEDAPHLIVTGMNDSCVPESVNSHAYLPNSARKFLGIADNEVRFARDAYLLSLLVETRKQGNGRVDFIFGRQSVSGDPLRPSRLLFQCPDEDLPNRTLQFFSGETREVAPLPWKLAWKLKPEKLPEDAKVFERLSVTAFKSYLTCPFRFYLKFGLEMEDVEIDKSEMNAMEFGNLVHDTLEAFGKDEEANKLTDPDQIRDYFYDQIDRILNYVFGRQWTTPVVVQREAARQRLSWWAEIEAEQRKAGWQILDPESQIGSEENPFMINGIWVRGRIDRIEKHNQFGYRVFDFKTMSPKDRGVIDFHISPIKRSEDIESFPEWCRVTNETGRLSRWTDLQLPLYRLALEERFPGDMISVGYVTLGRTKKEVAISMWEDIEDRYLESAKACAEGVVESIRSQTFWPPAERLPYRDNFEELFFGDPLEAVDASCFQ
ncbi:MAG: PD-(D/E)XK nuclease family protein [Verrucomicrobiales bacterium]|nr:PD-(D/E)XK nuclease family protein [Verrucomicrobiales bacterium]